MSDAAVVAVLQCVLKLLLLLLLLTRPDEEQRDQGVHRHAAIHKPLDVNLHQCQRYAVQLQAGRQVAPVALLGRGVWWWWWWCHISRKPCQATTSQKSGV